MDNEAPQIDGNYVFGDAVFKLSEFVDVQTLNTMTLVCHLWRDAALREKGNRVHLIQQWNGTFHGLTDLPSKLRTKPFASLFFYKGFDQVFSMEPGIEEFDKHKILTKYKEEVPNFTLASKVDHYFTMQNGRSVVVQSQSEMGCWRDRDLMGVFLPRIPKITYHTASVMEGVERGEPISMAVDRLIEDLGFNEPSNCKHSNSTILIFGMFNDYPIFCPVIDQLTKRQAKKGHEITLAGFYGSKIIPTEDDRGCICCGEMRKLLRISGPRIESWSTFIYFVDGSDEVHMKLSQLKERVKRKRHYIGLVFAPNCVIPRCYHYGHPYGNSTQLMKIVTRAFPYIQFTGLFVNYRSKRILSEADSMYDKQGSSMHANIIIISHD